MSETEYDYPSSYSLVSITDTSSYIKYASENFNEVAGFDEGELIGKPHNVVRHPDMPNLRRRLVVASVRRARRRLRMVACPPHHRTRPCRYDLK